MLEIIESDSKKGSAKLIDSGQTNRHLLCPWIGWGKALKVKGFWEMGEGLLMLDNGC